MARLIAACWRRSWREEYQHRRPAGGDGAVPAEGGTAATVNAAGLGIAAPVDSFTTQVVTVWSDVLDVSAADLIAGLDAAHTGATTATNFFALGGDSLAATTVCTTLGRGGCNVAVADLFAAPTLEAFLVRARGKDSGKDAGNGVLTTTANAVVQSQGADSGTPTSYAGERVWKEERGE